MKEEFRKFLEENGFLPLSNWECLDLLHVRPLSFKDKKQTFSKIRKNVGRKKGLYVYEKDGEVLYVGKGNLFSRIKSHYIESYDERGGDAKSKPWYVFFSSHQGRVKIYWRELRGEQIRTIIEQMLDYILKPKFQSFKKKYELKAKEKERQRY